ncbi:MAG: xanthine dehydrogenase family protein molybdopterin-binding subunit [Candidatus Hodarchaeales archaeon]
MIDGDFELTTVGKRLPRKDSWSKVDGKTRYIDDLEFADIAYVAVKRSTQAHAEITNIDIDTTKANVEVFTAKDIPGKNFVHIIYDDWQLLADKIVRHYAEPIAIVVADTPALARDGLSAIQITYSPLPAVFDAVEARNHPSIHIYKENNIHTSNIQKNGDFEKGITECDVIIEQEYNTPAQEHAYIEPQGVIAVPGDDELITIYGSMQCPFYVQRALTDILSIPLNKIRVIQTPTGGAFGGKEDVPSQVAALAALGAHLTNRPTKLIYSREEDVHSSSKRHPGTIRNKAGVKNGLIHAWKTEYILNSGAYATLGPAVLFRGTLHAVGPYKCPNVDIKSYLVATNLVPFGAFRGFGSPQVVFAAEEHVDRLAHASDIDPVEFRRKNLLNVNDTTTFGQVLNHSVGALKTLDKALEKSNWSKKWKKPPAKQELLTRFENDQAIISGIGISTIFYGVGLGAAGKHMSRSGSYVQIHADSSVLFSVGTTEMGQGMITVLAQIVAEALHVPYESVSMTPVDTSRVPDSGPTVASRGTTFPGRSLINACKKLTKKLLILASETLKIPVDQLQFKNYAVEDKNNQKSKITIKELVEDANSKRMELASTGWETAPPTDYDNEKGQGNAYIVYAFATNIVELEVDIFTGEVAIKKIFAAHDVGKAINPQTCEGQIEGGVVQGAGYGRYEEIIWDNAGKIISENLSTYIIPTTIDSPEVFSLIVEEPYIEGPYGAKGMAEQPIMGIAPAITNAIFNATGIRLSEIPITPERMWKAIQIKLEDARKQRG